MDAVSQVVIAALFAFHQYIPVDSPHTKYFEYAVDPVTLESSHKGILILAAAHESCRHFYQLAGGDFDMDDEQLSNFANGLIDKQEGNLLEVGASAAQTKEIIRRVCQEKFDPQSFTRTETKSIENFINEQVAVLTKKDLDSSGKYKFFGRVELYDRNGLDMGPLLSSADHWVAFEEISPLVSKALIAIEDSHFYVHQGVFLGSLSRMANEVNKAEDNSDDVTGGSTITMQLLKNLYFANWADDPESPFSKKSKLKTMLRKVREWYWAKVYEKYHEKLGPGSGKKFVLENYLNLMDYGPGIRGIDQAAQIFFKKEPIDLNLSDAAFIATLFQNPNRHARPSNYAEKTSVRYKIVLNQLSILTLAEHGLAPIEYADKQAALAVPLPQWLGNVPAYDDKYATDQYIRSYAQDFLSNNVEIPEGQRAMESELTTTIDSNLQKVVFDAVRARLDSYDKAKGRASVQRVMAARDDRSRVAIATDEDVSSVEDSAIKDLLSDLVDMQLNVQVAIYLGDQGVGKSDKSFYVVSNTDTAALPVSVQKELQSSFNSKARFVGQLLVAEISPSRCSGLEVNSQYLPLQAVLNSVREPEVIPEAGEEVAAPTPEAVDSTAPVAAPAAAALPPLPTANTEDAVVPLKLPEENIPLPRPRPANADEIIAKQKANAVLNRFFNLPIESRPAVEVPYALDETPSAACAYVLNANDFSRLSLANKFSTTQDQVSKKVVRNFLRRMEGLAPREDMYPALIDGRSGTTLVVVPSKAPEDSLAEYSQWVRPAPLVKGDADFLNNKIKRGEFRTGQTFWVSENGNQFELEAPKLQSAVVVIDSESGDVLANFGGYLPKTSKFFDRSRLAKRQPGSTLKPWLYFLALNKDFEPYSMIDNANVVFKQPGYKDYSPDNISGMSDKMMFETAFITSQNRPAVGLLSDYRFGSDPVQNLTEFVNLVTDVGLYDPKTVQVIGSTVLGSQELNILDLVSSYTFFSNGKKIVHPRFFKSLMSGQGDKLYTGEASSQEVPHSDNDIAVFQIQNMLMKVANAGTAQQLRDFTLSKLKLSQCKDQFLGTGGQVCFGGKTGTSNDLRDNWFIGFSRRFVIGVWVGYDFPESTEAYGGTIALPIFMDIVQQGQQFLPPIEPIVTQVPQGLSLVRVGAQSSCLATNGAGNAVFSKTGGRELNACITCSCEASYYGTDLYVDGSYYYNWPYSMNPEADMQSCRDYSKQLGCQ